MFFAPANKYPHAAGLYSPIAWGAINCGIDNLSNLAGLYRSNYLCTVPYRVSIFPFTRSSTFLPPLSFSTFTPSFVTVTPSFSPFQ